MFRKPFIFILTASFLCFGNIIPLEKKSEHTILYPYKVVLECSSNGSSYGQVNVSTNSLKQILINGIELNNECFCLEYDNVKVIEEDEISFSKDEPLTLEVYQIKNEMQQTPSKLKFSTSNPDYLKNEVLIYSNTVEILSDEMQKGRVEMEISKFKTDSVVLRFPYGGTYSSATIWKGKDRKPQNIIASLDGYEIGSEKNYIVWAKKDVGEFSVKFSSCHWFSDFQLVLI